MAKIPSWLARDDGQWLHPAKDYASTRFSSLDQIDVGNAGSLRLAFTFSTGVSKGHEAAPIVVGSTMYIVTPYPNYLYALRLEKSAATLKWTYKPNPDPAAQGVACCDVVNRGAVYREVPEKRPAIEKTVRDICPATPGGKDWQPSAFSPQTGLLYIPENNLCEEMEALEANYIEGTPFLGANIKMYAGAGGYRGALDAWDPVAGASVWSRKESFPAGSGVLATAGDLVFYGTLDGWFKAVDARSGNLIWQFKTASGIVGQPITYRGPDGKQYVAILSGVGGWAGLTVSGDVDPQDGTAAFGFAYATQDLPESHTQGRHALCVLPSVVRPVSKVF